VPETLEFILRALLIGIGATAILDLWLEFAQRVLAMPRADWALVGRWIGYFPRGRFVHDSIGKASPVAGERVIGWVAHYAIGVIFAGVLLSIFGLDWARRPTLLPALAVGLATIVFPFFLMQPGMGAGIAASRTPRPNVARLRSLVTHTVFGLGLYIAAVIAALLIPT
jgi:hypothetical protein